MGGQAYLRRCLDALRAQQGACQLEIVVAYDPVLPDIAALGGTYPEARFIENAHQRSPLELASVAIRETTGEQVLVTKDYCEPGPEWAQRLLGALALPSAAAGGPVVLPPEATPVEWAFSYLDFFPYTGPLVDGPTPVLTVCNAAYRRAELDALQLDWRTHFQESEVNQALVAQTGQPLRMCAAAPVRLHRSVDLQSALRERYALGRVFAAKRLEYASSRDKWLYRLGAPALPPLMMSRMAKKARTDPDLRDHFLGSLGPLSAMVLARTWGEWLGYVTSRPPPPSSR